MYKALIVDDEIMIRNGICKMLPWEKIGVEEVFTAESGESALEVISQKQPDIMLTDICMTDMNGLTLINMVNSLQPQMRIIVLTGYDNFEYVQQCCRMNVQDFILKPADEKELIHAIQTQTAELDKLHGIEQYQKVMRRAQGVAEQLRLEQGLRGLLHGREPASKVSALFQEYNCPADQPLQVVIIIPALESDAGWKDHHALLSMSIKSTCIALFDSNYEGITFEDDDGRIILVLFTSDGFDDSIERMEKLGSLLKNELEFSPILAIGSSVSGFNELPVSYNDALYLLGETKSTELVILSGSAEIRRKIFNEVFNELKHVIVTNIGDVDKIMRAFSSFSIAVESYNLSVSVIRRCCFDIASSLYYNFINDSGEMIDNKLSALLSSLMVCGRDEACKLTHSFISRLLGSEEYHELITSAKRHIVDNLAEDLSVSSIAAKLYVTPNYFSRLFKRVTGEGCNGYIVRKRMEKAKSLLTTTNLKTGKIAGMVGYNDTNYFSLAFKKYTGFSPTSFRESNR